MMMKKRLLVVAGAPAAGKTTFARRYAGDRGLPVFCRDDYKETLSGFFPYETREDTVLLGKASYAVLERTMAHTMASGISFAVESNFTKMSETWLDALLRTYRYNAMTLLFCGDLPAPHGRFIARNGTGQRHAVHVSPYYDDIHTFVSGITSSGILDFHVGGAPLRVDTTDFAAYDYDAVARRVDRWLYGDVG